MANCYISGLPMNQCAHCVQGLPRQWIDDGKGFPIAGHTYVESLGPSCINVRMAAEASRDARWKHAGTSTAPSPWRTACYDNEVKVCLSRISRRIVVPAEEPLYEVVGGCLIRVTPKEPTA